MPYHQFQSEYTYGGGTLEQHIPFTKNSKKIPFFKRETYQGADTLWVITINPRRYGQARRVIDGMDRAYRERLVLSNY